MAKKHKGPKSSKPTFKKSQAANEESKNDPSSAQKNGAAEPHCKDNTEQRIVELLHGSCVEDLPEEDKEKRIRDVMLGIELVYRHYSKRIRRFARRRFPYLSSEDLADAWSDTLLDLMRRALRGKFKKTGSLYWLLKRIMNRRCIDRIRKRQRRAYEQYWENIEDWVEDCSVSLELVDEVFVLMKEAIAELPWRQKWVWIEYEATGFSATSEELAARLRTKTGREWTKAGVRRARQEGRKKLRLFFRERGYDDGNR